ncbi:MAG: efflux RND transporter periplasmic adaptor subunit [Myxococcales bacterium]|nr:efflux RND transporter periplasmic adaptor subunit [Myxococcales bacterium]
MTKKLWILLAAAASTGVAGWLLVPHFSPAPAPTGEVIEVRQGEIVETASATGRIEPAVQVEVKSRAAGEVIEVLVEEGAEVEAGQVLFRLDPRDAARALEDARVALRRVQAELAQSRANLAVTEAQARDAQATRGVSARGAELGLVSMEADRASATSVEVAQANVQLRQAAVQASSAALAAARLSVADAEQRLSEMEIRAPIGGTLLSVAVERGSIVASAVTNVGGGTALATLANLSDLRVIGAIDEAQIARVQVGQQVEIRVDAYPDRTFSGEVIRVSPLGVIETNVVTFDVEIRVTDPDASLLRSGMSADLSIETGRSEGVLVPLAAVRTEGRRRVVELESGETRTIRTGETDGRRILVREGLSPGDRLRVGGAVPTATQGPTKSIIPTGRPGGGRKNR